LSCNFCPKTKRKLEILSGEQFQKVIEAVKPYTDYIYLHLMGEPTLHKDLRLFLEIAYEAGLEVNLTTNGTLLHEVEDVLIEAKSLRQVNISLHSFEANDQGVDLSAYVEQIARFVNKAAPRIICSMRLWNKDSETLKASNALNMPILHLLEEAFHLQGQLSEALQHKPSFKLQDHVYLNMAEKFDWPDIDKADDTGQMFCYGLRDQLGILVDGTVVPCCLDSEGNIPLGNIYETSLEEILKSPRATRIYEGFSNRQAVEELCKRCGYAKRY
ncbi:MAG: SPASM domain-containing protein, partial [Niameybacter sp.]